MNITASGGGIAAGTIHGNVAPANPTRPGPATSSRTREHLDHRPGSVSADRGGTAVGVQYQRPEVASQPVRLAPRPVFLAGREKLLAELDARLSAGRAAGPRVVALCGLGGAGKTSVALEYAHRHLAGLGVVWQFAAEEPTVLAAEFGELAAQLGARTCWMPVTRSRQVHAVLAARPGGWLLIFDNAPDPAAVRDVLPPGRAGPGADHQPEPALAAGQAVDVPVLDQEVAAGSC